MKFISKWFLKRKRFKAFLKVLRPYLKEKYGKSINLEYSEVHDALIFLELNGEYEEYAYAMSLSKSQFKHHRKINNIKYTQGALQSELGVSTELLETHYPNSSY